MYSWGELTHLTNPLTIFKIICFRGLSPTGGELTHLRFVGWATKYRRNIIRVYGKTRLEMVY